MCLSPPSLLYSLLPKVVPESRTSSLTGRHHHGHYHHHHEAEEEEGFVAQGQVALLAGSLSFGFQSLAGPFSLPVTRSQPLRQASPVSVHRSPTEPRRSSKLSANPTPSGHDSSVAASMQRARGNFAATKKTSPVRLFSQSLSNIPPSEQRSRVIGSATLCVVNVPDPQI
ncbi:hypothetical protein GQ607_004068 [Colletotrichum asianum]|uniref:Uncharacterized protein n=1 Tax=Colletotrichum asianum TaxID=702518 RepID=A0A8H3WMP7_9PEZI|nr:hypothetical protein GQ607_004068 [Colletotrichum asianum]